MLMGSKKEYKGLIENLTGLQTSKREIVVMVVLFAIAMGMVIMGKSAEVQALTGILITFGLVLTALQIKLNKTEIIASHDRARREYALELAHRITREVKETRDQLNKLTRASSVVSIENEIKNKSPECIGKCKIVQNGPLKDMKKFSDRYLEPIPLSFQEVHDWVCEHYIDAEGEIKSRKDDSTGNCRMTEHGEAIRNNLISLINNYEELATGILSTAAHEEVLYKLYFTPVKKSFEFFREYIKHARERHAGNRFANNFEWLYNRWHVEQYDPMPKPEDTL